MSTCQDVRELANSSNYEELLQLITFSNDTNQYNHCLVFMEQLFEIPIVSDDSIYSYGTEMTLLSRLLCKLLKPCIPQFEKQNNFHHIDSFKQFYSPYIHNMCEKFISLTTKHHLLFQELINKSINTTKDFDYILRWIDCLHIKLVSDCYFYIYDITGRRDHELYLSMIQSHEKGYLLARKHLNYGLIERLLMVNNYGVLKISFGKNILDSIIGLKILKQEFDETLMMLDDLEESEYKSTTFIMKIMRNNLFALPDAFDQNNMELMRLFAIPHWCRKYELLCLPGIIDIIFEYSCCDYDYHGLQNVNRERVRMYNHCMEISDQYVYIQFLYYAPLQLEISPTRRKS